MAPTAPHPVDPTSPDAVLQYIGSLHRDTVVHSPRSSDVAEMESGMDWAVVLHPNMEGMGRS